MSEPFVHWPGQTVPLPTSAFSAPPAPIRLWELIAAQGLVALIFLVLQLDVRPPLPHDLPPLLSAVFWICLVLLPFAIPRGNAEDQDRFTWWGYFAVWAGALYGLGELWMRFAPGDLLEQQHQRGFDAWEERFKEGIVHFAIGLLGTINFVRSPGDRRNWAGLVFAATLPHLLVGVKPLLTGLVWVISFLIHLLL